MRRYARLSVVLCALAAPAGAVETIRYADPDGTIHTAEIVQVFRESDKEFKGKVREGGRVRTVTIPSRLVVDYRRGSDEDKNQWSRKLAQAARLTATGKLVTRGTDIGAEEVLESVTYSTEKGTPGQEESERIEAWHNMYGLFQLIQVRYEAGKQGDAARLQRALQNVDEFVQRTESRAKTISWEVPIKDGTRSAKIYAWGETWLLPEVLLYKARILRAMGKQGEAEAAYEDVIEKIKKEKWSPILLATAVLERAEMAAEGVDTDRAEKAFRDAGVRLSGEVRGQPDEYGKHLVLRAANRALLRGADLLLASAEEGGSVSFQNPLERYRELRDREGRDDPALYMGAQTGYGICLLKTEQPEKAYEALQEVAVLGFEYPAHVERSLYYLGVAAPAFAEKVEGQGGDGAFLRQAGERWWRDLRARYPGSKWADKTKSK